MITVRVEQGDDPTKVVKIHVFSGVDGTGKGLYHGTLAALPGEVADIIVRRLKEEPCLVQP